MKKITLAVREYYWYLESIAKNQPILFWIIGLILLYTLGNVTSLFNILIQSILSLSSFFSDRLYLSTSNGIIDNEPYFMFGTIISLLFLIMSGLIRLLEKSVIINNTNLFQYISLIIIILCMILQSKIDYRNSKIIDFQKELIRAKTLIGSQEKINDIEYQFSTLKNKNDYDSLIKNLKNLKTN